jgi:hypothetical protein
VNAIPAAAALKIAYVQAARVMNGRAFIARMTQMLEGEIPGALLGSLTELAETMMLDFAIEGPADLLVAPMSCMAPGIPHIDVEDLAAIDAIYGDGFAAHLLDLAGQPVGSRWEPDPMGHLARRVEDIAIDVAAISEKIREMAGDKTAATVR